MPILRSHKKESGSRKKPLERFKKWLGRVKKYKTVTVGIGEEISYTLRDGTIVKIIPRTLMVVGNKRLSCELVVGGESQGTYPFTLKGTAQGCSFNDSQGNRYSIGLAFLSVKHEGTDHQRFKLRVQRKATLYQSSPEVQ